jgi:hypothetical protein
MPKFRVNISFEYETSDVDYSLRGIAAHEDTAYLYKNAARIVEVLPGLSSNDTSNFKASVEVINDSNSRDYARADAEKQRDLSGRVDSYRLTEWVPGKPIF